MKKKKKKVFFFLLFVVVVVLARGFARRGKTGREGYSFFEDREKRVFSNILMEELVDLWYYHQHQQMQLQL